MNNAKLNIESEHLYTLTGAVLQSKLKLQVFAQQIIPETTHILNKTHTSACDAGNVLVTTPVQQV